MLNAIKNISNRTETENGAAAFSTSGSDCLDFFSTVGGLRDASSEEVVSRFVRAYCENPDYAMKLLFFTRDIRGGLGERKIFKTILTWLSDNKPMSMRKNIAYVAEYGRFDDLLSLLGTACEGDMLMCLKEQFDKDMYAHSMGETVSLLGKWLPSINASNKDAVKAAKKIAKSFGLTDAEYRKALSALRKDIKIIENNLREKDYTFDYEKQPSKALLKYRAAFRRNDSDRYLEFIMKVNSGEAKLNASTIMPYEIVGKTLSTWGDFSMPNDADVLDATWKSLPNYVGSENMLAVVDGSGSMYAPMYGVSPASVALSLGIYFAERNMGAFHNHFITFSARPQLIEIKGEDICSKVEYVHTFDEVANTNLQAVFELILNAAISGNMKQEDIPSKLVIISDMEFDYAVNNASATIFEDAKAKFEANGFKLPEIVFWNVASRKLQQPVKMNEQGVALVSGATPRLFEMVASGDLEPYKVMLDVVSSERYAPIVA